MVPNLTTQLYLTQQISSLYANKESLDISRSLLWFKLLYTLRKFRSFRDKNYLLIGNFVSKKQTLERILFTTMPDLLMKTLDQLVAMNKTIYTANENHLHTFWMMKYILRCTCAHACVLLYSLIIRSLDSLHDKSNCVQVESLSLLWSSRWQIFQPISESYVHGFILHSKKTERIYSRKRIFWLQKNYEIRNWLGSGKLRISFEKDKQIGL